MNWALKEAKKLIDKYPERDKFVIASGVSPSGFIHIGNFREIVTTYFVGKELEKLGKKVRFILSFDDFDRFRKVPNGLPKEFSKYIGIPYTSIPSPFNKNKSYAEEMEERFLKELNEMGIYPEVISQTKQYKSGRYNDKIKLAMSKRKEIFDILSKYKTQEFTDAERNDYYPISLYCNCCGKDSTKIIDYNETTGQLEYQCSCGHRETENINTTQNIKLHWKIDWPMRWQQEQVVFEPGGRDHSAANGSYVVSKEIATKIFHYEAPDYIAYDFIGIKGNNGKMSSSTGNVLTLTDLLNVYDKYMILWLYAKNNPNHKFNIALDEDVIRFYTEFDRIVKSYFNDNLDERNKSILSLIEVPKNYLKNPDFGTIANFLPMVNYNIDALISLLKKENIDCTSPHFHSRLFRAINWLEKYNNSKLHILEKFNEDFFNGLSDLEKEWIFKTINVLQKKDYENIQELQNELYSIVKEAESDTALIKRNQKRYFQIIYNMIIGQNKGPKLGLLLSALDDNQINELLNPERKRLIKNR